AVDVLARRDLAAAHPACRSTRPRRSTGNPDQHARGRQPHPPGQTRPAREHDAERRSVRHAPDGFRHPGTARQGHHLWQRGLQEGDQQGQVRSREGPRLARAAAPAAEARYACSVRGHQATWPCHNSCSFSSNLDPMRHLFVTTALPYANGPFHIGHIMEYIQADIWVRFQRMLGNRVHFVCADDAHGAPIMLKAQDEGIEPEELIARIAADRPQYLQGFAISFDHWHSTHSPENVELSTDIYRKLKEAGLIYVKPVEQFFDPVKQMFLPDRYVKGECPKCHAKDQYGDACEVCSTVYAPTDLINPYSTLSGATPVRKV